MTRSTKLEVPAGHSLHHVVCPHDCPDTCSMLVTRDDRSGRAVAVQGDPTHPITRGFLCNKVNHYLDFVYNPDRVLYPHKRIGPKGPGARFERITWDEALDTVTANFNRIIDRYGAEAIQPFNFSGTLGQIGYWTLDNRFWNRMGAARLEMSICIHAAFWACMHTYGSANGPDLAMASREAELILLWGVNPVSTGVHAVPFLREAQARGCRLVVIDPRPTRSSWLADWHVQPRPGTDAALALGMMRVLVERGLHDQAFLEQHTRGWRELIEHKLPDYPLAKVAELTGLAAADIERLALLYGATRKSYIRGGHGLNRHQNSGQMCRAVLLLPAITGAWREACGGAGFGRLEENWNPFYRPDIQRNELGDRDNRRIVNMVQMGRALAEDIGWNGAQLDPPIKCLFVYNADPANCVPNVANMHRGLLRDDLFTVVHDTMWTDSCDYADVVLPADTQLERTDFHGAYGYYHYAMNRPVIAPLGESVSNADLFRRLAARMGYVEDSGDAFTQSDEDIIREHFLDASKNVLVEGISFEQLLENGWACANYDHPQRRYLERGWPTPDGKIQIWSDALAAEGQDPLPTHHAEMEGQEDPLRARFPLQILSNASHYFVGDSFQTVERLRAMQSRPTFELNPAEARRRGIADGDLCRLYNDRGETYGYALLQERMLPGVIGTQKQFKGSRTPGGINVNALNTEVLTDFGLAPSFYSCLAEIEPADDAMRARVVEQQPRADISSSRVLRNRGRIVRLRALTHDTVELVVACVPGSRPINARAGQFATLTVPGVARPRAYSFARDPRAEAAGEHTFFIRRVPGGEFSAWLEAADRTGTELEIAGPLGAFALDDSSAPMLMIAGGSGLSAIKALAEEAARRRLERDCVLLYGARSRADLHAEEALAAVAAAWHPAHRFEFVRVLSEEPADGAWSGPRGLVTEYFRTQLLGRDVFQPGTFRVWLCGPPPMIAAAETLLRDAGVPDSHVRRDIFDDVRSPAPVIDNRRCVLCDECLLVKPVANCIVETGAISYGEDGRVAAYSPLAPGRTAGLYYNALVIDPDACIRCHACINACPHGAIS